MIATTGIRSLLNADGIRFMYESLVPNFMSFTAVGLMIAAMIGAGVAEASGLVTALIRKLVAVSPGWALSYILAFVGILVERRRRCRLSGAAARSPASPTSPSDAIRWPASRSALPPWPAPSRSTC